MPVAVWEISDADEERLDRYEGFPNYYIKEEWPVTVADGSEIKGMIYLMKFIRTAPPTRDYFFGILNAYEELGFGSEINTVLTPAVNPSLQRKRHG